MTAGLLNRTEVKISVHVVDAETYQGEWLDLWDYPDEDEFRAAVGDATNNADEIVLVEAEGLSDLPKLMTLAFLWSLHELINVKTQWWLRPAMAAYLAYECYSPDCEERFEDAYCGEWASIEDYAIEFYEDVYGPFNVPGYKIAVDTDAWLQDHFEAVAPDGSQHVFRHV